MTIEEIEKTLPTGFHDAFLEKINIDYYRGEVKIDISFDTGNHETFAKSLEKSKRMGRLTLTDLLYCIIEPPDSRYPYKKVEGLWIADSGPIKSEKLLAKLPEALTKGSFAHYFFINDWNAFIIVAAADARFDWS